MGSLEGGLTATFVLALACGCSLASKVLSQLTRVLSH